MNYKKAINIISALLLLLFLYTGLSKILDYQIFRIQLEESPLLKSYSGVISIGLPLLEIAISVLLLFERTRFYGIYSAGVMLFVFTVYLSYMISNYPHLPCTCGGVITSLSWPQHLIMNIVFLSMTIWTFYVDVISRRKVFQQNL